MKDYVPLFQSLIWPLFLLIIVYILRKQLLSLMKSIDTRIQKGSVIKVGEFEIGRQEEFVTKTEDLPDDVKIFGDPDRLQLLIKAKSKTWSKSTKAMEVPGGCIVQVSSEQKNPDGSWSIAEALTFVPDVVVVKDAQGVGRHLDKLQLVRGGEN